jgi:hypothetical protein
VAEAAGARGECAADGPAQPGGPESVPALEPPPPALVRSHQGLGPEHVTRTRMYFRSADDFEDVARAHGEVFGEIRPATAAVVVAALVDPRWLVEIEADAVVSAR